MVEWKFVIFGFGVLDVVWIGWIGNELILWFSFFVGEIFFVGFLK